VVEVYEAQSGSKVNASSKSGSSLSLRAMGKHRGVVVKTNMEENRGKYEFVENEKEEAVNQPATQQHGGVRSRGGVQGCREVRGGEGMFWEPLTIARDSVIKNSRYYSDREEVLSELSRSSLSFPLPQQMKFEADVKKGVEKHSMTAGFKKRIEKKDTLKECSLGRCRRAASTNLCPGGVLDGNKRHRIVF
jgi:hypothetical protein